MPSFFFSRFHFCLHLEDCGVLCEQIEFIHPKNLCFSVCLKLRGSGEDYFEISSMSFRYFANVFSLFRCCLSIEKSETFYLNKLVFYIIKDALCQV